MVKEVADSLIGKRWKTLARRRREVLANNNVVGVDCFTRLIYGSLLIKHYSFTDPSFSCMFLHSQSVNPLDAGQLKI